MAFYRSVVRARAESFAKAIARDWGFRLDRNGRPSVPCAPNSYRTYVCGGVYYVSYWAPRETKPFKAVPKRGVAPRPGEPFRCPTKGCRGRQHCSHGLCTRCHNRWTYWNKPERRSGQIARARANYQRRKKRA